MAKDVILKRKLVRQYSSNIDVGKRRKEMPAVEAKNIAIYLYNMFSGSWDTVGWSEKKIHWRDAESRLDVIVKTSICSNAPFTLAFDARIKYLESFAKSAEEVIAALAAYNYNTMRQTD